MPHRVNRHGRDGVVPAPKCEEMHVDMWMYFRRLQSVDNISLFFHDRMFNPLIGIATLSVTTIYVAPAHSEYGPLTTQRGSLDMSAAGRRCVL